MTGDEEKKSGIAAIESDEPIMENAPEQGITENKTFYDIVNEVEDEIYNEGRSEIEDDQEETKLKEVELEDDSDENEEEVAEENEEDSTEEDEDDQKEEEEEKDEEEDVTSESPEWLEAALKSIDENIDVSSEESVTKAIESLKNEADTVREDLKSEREANQTFYDLLKDNESLLSVSRYMVQNKVDLETALMVMGVEPAQDLEKLKKEDPDAYIDLMQKKKDAEAKALESESEREANENLYKENVSKTKDSIEAFKASHEIGDKEFDLIADKINPHIDNLTKALVDESFLELMYKGLNYEEEIAKAEERGRIEGRKSKIQAKAEQKRGDGLPDVKTTHEKKPMAKKERNVFDDALEPESTRITDLYRD